VQAKEKVCATAETIYRETAASHQTNKSSYSQIESVKQSDSMFVYTWKRHQNQESETKSIHSIYEVHKKRVDVDSQVAVV
jgi:hypothetical protein